ncbi:MAG: beta-Ala-His dipeptidase [Bacteroidales bacterium]|nr:beta-Ala-His dipeptidase [Bacteroidales bacterium]
MDAQILWSHFEQICQIPHASGHLDAMRVYIIKCVESAEETADVDAAGNVRVLLSASPEWLARQDQKEPHITTLQAHMDMVVQANAETSFNFFSDPIRPCKAGGKMTATGTSLGADNGIGMAAMLAILSDKRCLHGPLELLFTVDEEVGMKGVHNLPSDWLKGKYLLNLDAEQEGELMLGCAGAVDITATYRYKLEPGIPEGDTAVLLTLKGLKGGHSGMDIHLGRGNACKLMVRFLKHAVVNFEARLAWVQGGGVRNAIPREASAVLTVPSEVVDDLLDEVAYYADLFRYELRGIDPGVVFAAQVIDDPESLVPEEVQDDILNSLEAAHDGIFRYVPDMPNVVETSSNLATISMEHAEGAGLCSVTMMVRSMNEEMKRALASRLQSCFILGGARVQFSAAYPGWEEPLNGALPTRVRNAYRQLFGTEMKVNSVHCGLECGVIRSKYPQMEIASIGPTIRHPHSPEESVDIESVERFWQLLLAII